MEDHCFCLFQIWKSCSRKNLPTLFETTVVLIIYYGFSQSFDETQEINVMAQIAQFQITHVCSHTSSDFFKHKFFPSCKSCCGADVQSVTGEISSCVCATI